MLGATVSGCINHPGVEAVTRCKQCGRPVCGACVESGPTGAFCSTVCRDKHQAFVARAQSMGSVAPRIGVFRRLKSFVGKLILLTGLLVLLGVFASVVDIPVISELTQWVRDLLGI